jgi:hypothetical protein
LTYTHVSNLEEAAHIAEHSGGGGILLDALHFRRFGGTLEQLRSLEPGLLSYAQLCDAPLAPPNGDCRNPVNCPAGNPQTAPTCSWRAEPCASCRETASCRWRSFSLRCLKGCP